MLSSSSALYPRVTDCDGWWGEFAGTGSMAFEPTPLLDAGVRRLWPVSDYRMQASFSCCHLPKSCFGVPAGAAKLNET